MQYTYLGSSNQKISRIGVGCAGMSEFYSPSSKQEAKKVLFQAIEVGVNFFDTADMYGKGENEELISSLCVQHRKDIVISTKCGVDRKDIETGTLNKSLWTVDNSRTYIRKSCENSLKRLKTDYIDLYYLHSWDKITPIEEIISTLAELKKEGKIKHIGLSNIYDANILKRAINTDTIAALQNEYSLWDRSAERVFPICKENNITFVAHSPLGNGALSGKVDSITNLNENDLRKNTRDYDKKLSKHKNAVSKLRDLATINKCTMAQLCLYWLVSNEIIEVLPIPGCRTLTYLNDNLAALSLNLDNNTKIQLNNIFTF